MKLFRNPGPRETAKLISKYWSQDSTVLHYTGHMFGIGCRLSSQTAMNRISEYKQRKEKGGFIVLISDIDWLHENNVDIPSELHLILSQYWPGNLTVIIPTDNPLFDNVAVNGKVAFRVPFDKLLRDVLENLREPIISTSINLSGVHPADNLNDIQKRFSEWFDIGFIPAVTKLSEPSTIIEYIDTDADGNPVLPHLKCLRESTIPFYQIKQSFSNPVVLFICMGNICRSPIAEYLFNHYSRQKNLPFTAKSAGLMDSGNMISLNSMQLLAEQNIMSQEHSSRKINPEILNGSWLILTMEEYHKKVIRDNFPETAHKVFTLNEFVGRKGDIDDPYGSDIDNYRITYGEIDEAVRLLVEMLEKQQNF